MRAAVVTAVETIELREVATPPAPGPGEVLLAPQAVGVCGSDLHYFLGHMDDARFPRVLGHELAATVAAVGEGVGLQVGQTVALWPLRACGACDACRAGRGNACPNFAIIGIHADGGLQEALLAPAEQCFPIDAPPALAALAEPVSVAIHAVARGGVVPREAVVVLGAGPIGQAIGLVAQDRGARVLLVDRLAERLEVAAALGLGTLVARDQVDVVARAREWAGGDGPPLVFDATGVAAAAADAQRMARPAGRIVLVGLPGADATIPMGVITHKELDVLGASCCTREEFAAAVAFVERRGDALADLITGQWALDDVGAALRRAIDRPAESMKLIVRVGAEIA